MRRPLLSLALCAASLAVLVAASGGPADARPAVVSFTVDPALTLARIDLAGAASIAISAGSTGARLEGSTLLVPLAFDPARTGAARVGVRTPTGDRTISVEYYPASVYRSIGVTWGGTVLLYTDLPRVARPRLDGTYRGAVAPAEDVTIHDQKRWIDARYVGDIPLASQPADDALLELFRRLEAMDRPVGKLCSDLLPGIDTYYAVEAGSCDIWCSGYSRIARDFLRSMDVPARILDLTADGPVLPGGVLVQTSEAHETVERWDGDHWAWVDPTFRILRVSAGSSTAAPSLSVYDTILALADPTARDRLRFSLLDSGTGGWAIRSWNDLEPALQASLLRDLSSDKTLGVAEGGRG